MTVMQDLLVTARGRVDRPSRHRPFAICVAPDKRKALYDEMDSVRRIVGEPVLPYEVCSLKVAYALIGTIR